MLLLNGRYAPITFGMAFIEAGLDAVAEGMRDWDRELEQRRLLSRPDARREVRGSLDDLLAPFPPFTYSDSKWLLLETAGPWTAYLNNCSQGTDAPAVAMTLPRRLKCRSVRIQVIPNTASDRHPERPGTFGSMLFELNGPEKAPGLNTIRRVHAINDGPWKWVGTGDPLPFENLEAYTAKRIRDRLTGAMIVDYCAHFGIFPDDPAFFGRRGVFGERQPYEREGPPVYLSFQEAREKYGLPPQGWPALVEA
ncbi:MAG TPA: hypothetical protein VHN99_08635 [Deinococcales bacterium]|nr:hypothetical protein [Deinococcales bacterium]